MKADRGLQHGGRHAVVSFSGHSVDAVAEGMYSYRWQDVAQYALAVGAGPADLKFVYERHGPLVLPTFAVIPAYPVAHALNARLGGDPLGVLHLRQRVVLCGSLPASGRVFTRGVIEGVYDHGTMASSVVSTKTHDLSGDLLFTTEWTVGYMRNGGFGGPRAPERERIRVPREIADLRLESEVSPVQALMYRLLGDENPVHVDPAFACKAGFPRPILHGLCTYGLTCLGVLRACAFLDPQRVREFRAEFRRPVFPGNRLITIAWRAIGTLTLRTIQMRDGVEEEVQRAFLRMQS